MFDLLPPFECIHIVHLGSHRMSLNIISDEKNFPVYYNGTSKTNYKNAMYVVNKGNCVTIEELQSISDNEREASSFMWWVTYNYNVFNL